MTPQTAFRSDERFTQADFRTWLEERPGADINRYELLRGRIIATPPAGWPHGRLEATLVCWLGERVHKNKLGVVQGSSAGYDLPSGDTVEPDASYVSRARLAAGPAPQSGRFLRIVPDLAVEIFSPATARRDRTEKKAIYERNGVREYWLVDAEKRTVAVFRLRKGQYGPARTFSRGSFKSGVVPGLIVSVEEVFAS